MSARTALGRESVRVQVAVGSVHDVREKELWTVIEARGKQVSRIVRDATALSMTFPEYAGIFRTFVRAAQGLQEDCKTMIIDLGSEIYLREKVATDGLVRRKRERS